MITRVSQVLTYILFCVVQRAAPWKYFQLNADYFNEELGIYSKLETDKLIPKRWRLPQVLDTSSVKPLHFPVFVKPEWGQNSFGVQRANNQQELDELRADRKQTSSNYLVQQAARGKREFEVFIIPSTNNTRQPAVLSVTETLNHSGDPYPINGIYNQATSYKNLTKQLTVTQRNRIWEHLSQVGDFRLSRVGLRADSIDGVINGDFKIIEINLLYPMPLVVLADNCTRRDKIHFSVRAMWFLAAITKTIPASQPHKSIFVKKLSFGHPMRLFSKMSTNNERT